MKYSIVVLVVLCVSTPNTLQAQDLSGMALFEEHCSECHRASNYEGGDAKKIAATISKMAGGQMKHKVKIGLDRAQILAVAEYMATGR